jgi:gliding motility-associated-like protein
MKEYRYRTFVAIFLLIAVFAGKPETYAQVSNPYFLNGSASQDNCNCYTLTRDANNQSGSVWNIYKINLRDSFDFKFSVFLGSADDQGADGMAFVLQPISTNIGSLGGGLGFDGVSPSIGITIDTWQNTNNNDPAFDHISIQRNGDLNHNSLNNISGPVTALAGNNNIEDGNWHLFRIQWDPASKILRTYLDGIERLSVTTDLVGNVFNNDPQVFWGFTASTGGARNLQRFCTALNPAIKSLSNQETCFGKPINFKDSSSSFSKITKWFWDFGDGTTDTVQNPPPHLYAAPGNYTVKLNILGDNGCLSDTLYNPIIVGSDPFAKIAWSPSPACENMPIILTDSSSVIYGSVNQWTWKINNTIYTSKNPVLTNGLPAGNNLVSLSVRTAEGCISPVETKVLPVLPAPQVDFTYADICAGEMVMLQGLNLTPPLSIDRWIWTLGDGRTDSSGNAISPVYANNGTYQVKLQARAINRCLSKDILHSIKVTQTNAFAGNDTIVAMGQPFQLNGSGGDIYQWSPAFGLSNPGIANPIAVLDQDAVYYLTASTAAGCASADTINIKVFKGPEIYVPTAFTPNGDGLNDILKALPVGLNFSYFRIYDRWGNLVFSTTDHRIGWNGNQKGKDSNPGTYIWVTSGTQPDGKVVTKKGTFQLIR